MEKNAASLIWLRLEIGTDGFIQSARMEVATWLFPDEVCPMKNRAVNLPSRGYISLRNADMMANRMPHLPLSLMR